MSAYDKFDYAKEAIKLGVMEYITKPMEKTRIVNALRKAMENIDAERLKRKNELLIKEKLETVVPTDPQYSLAGAFQGGYRELPFHSGDYAAVCLYDRGGQR